MRVIGIDYGRARIGIALGDTDSRIANAWEVLENKGTDLSVARIAEICKEEGAEKVVLGLPRPLRDALSDNAQTIEIKAFADALRSVGLDVHMADEALTSRVAAAQARESGRRGAQDDLAASAILQGWLEDVRRTS